MPGRQLFLVGEGLATFKAKGTPHHFSTRTNDGARESDSTTLTAGRAFRYGRMFRKSASRPQPEALTNLGLAMHAQNSAADDHPYLPAGYTYLGQFVTHDITFDRTEGLADGELSALQIRQGRSPSLELDSLYGMGPLSESSRHLYEDDRLKFKIGMTTPTRFGDAFVSLPNDLPRDGSRNALIAERRNDRNLALAQTHLAFLKFHNAVVDRLLKQGLLGKELYEAARKKVIQHYQWIILHDYLPKILEESVLKDVLASDAKAFRALSGDDRFLPVEFAFAAYRFGHSLVRDEYEWNRVFQSPKNGNLDAARLHQLFTFTGMSGTMQGSPTLPTNWVIDWTRFFDFSGFAGVANHAKSNLAQKIDTSLSLGLKGLPGFPTDVPIESRSIAVLDLLMDAMLGLPTGQEVADALSKKKIEVRTLSAKEIAGGPHKDILTQYGLHEKTPLWYYILKEAEVLHRGERLGPIGSRIVAETLVGLIHASEFSILEDSGWEPDLGQIKLNEFGMADLLAFVNDLNPLEAQPDKTNTVSAEGARANKKSKKKAVRQTAVKRRY